MTVTITDAAEDVTAVHFVDEAEKTETISGTVSDDSNNNNNGDIPLPVVVVDLNLCGSIIRTTVTGSDGLFVFKDVPSSTYTVKEQTPADLADVSDSEGDNPNSVAVPAKRNAFLVIVEQKFVVVS